MPQRPLDSQPAPSDFGLEDSLAERIEAPIAGHMAFKCVRWLCGAVLGARPASVSYPRVTGIPG